MNENIMAALEDTICWLEDHPEEWKKGYSEMSRHCAGQHMGAHAFRPLNQLVLRLTRKDIIDWNDGEGREAVQAALLYALFVPEPI